MALAFKKGDQVAQVVPVIQGEVLDMQIIDGEVQYLVAYTENGEAKQRYFKEAEIAAAV
jgi:hypothetical protein